MAIRDLVKGELDWHTKINANFKEMEQDIVDKMDKPVVGELQEGYLYQEQGGTVSLREGSGGTSVDILDSKEEIEANTESGKSAGALGVKEMVNELSNDLVSDIYVGDDGKLHKVQGGADTVLPFSSGSVVYRVGGINGSINIKNYIQKNNIPVDFTKLTKTNFLVEFTSININVNAAGESNYNPPSFGFTKTYNATTGVLSVANMSYQSEWHENRVRFNYSTAAIVYMVVGEIK